ncbi:long-chain-fatty-acid--CoA ligase [Solemya velesiana gill symbiont]|uniref:Long-chain fatty acid--CoA ligase n=1 Tax=Solemya velesiana gill symbiont TaxID=1918948 RepID=A0A1T2KTL4_9GAMM|nr:long-chain fatty acid--CoA ligase [Solemya velesiana gill symbiont]OOZ36162.1 long-chain fatty acid--CoA ligase [Solemya velesiana gill symbiont]
MTDGQTPSIPDRFRATAAERADQPVICFPDREVTFSEVDRASDAVAASLVSQGIEKGDRVALYCINSDAFAIAYMGIVKSGAVVVPVNLLQNPREITYVLNDAGVRGLFYHQLFAEAVESFRGELKNLAFAVGMGSGPFKEGDLVFDEFCANTSVPPKPEFDTANDLAAILYTSGTTGHPKGAMLTHRNLVSNTNSVVQALQLRPGEDRLLVVLPMFHSFAATVGTLTPLLHGLSLAPVPKFDPAAVCDVIEAVGATVFLGVPSMYSVLLRLPDEQVAKWKSVRYCVSGGAAMPVEVMRQFEAQYGLAIHEGDGPTECSPVTCVNPIGGERKAASVGLPVPDVEMEIYDDEGKQLAVDVIGEICVRGPNVMKGYWNLPEATTESFFGEWVRTGDLGYKDVDGYVYIVDRKKDMVIVNGMNVYPRMVEEVLYQFPKMAEAAVVGEPSELHGEIVVAYVVAREGEEMTPAEVRAYCCENLGPHQVPRKVVVKDALPKNAAGKILKRELRKAGELERGGDSRETES